MSAGTTNATARPKKQSNSARIREAIIAAARKVFMYRGYDATLDEIADVAGVARRSIYYIYGSKEKLFLQIFEDMIELNDLVSHLDPKRDVKTVLVEFAQVYLSRVLSDDHVTAHRVLHAEQHRFPEAVRDVSNAHFARISPPVEQYFESLMADGRLRPGDQGFAAEQYLTMLIGYARVRQALEQRRDTAERRAAYLASAVDCFLYGMAPR